MGYICIGKDPSQLLHCEAVLGIQSLVRHAWINAVQPTLHANLLIADDVILEVEDFSIVITFQSMRSD